MAALVQVGTYLDFGMQPAGATMTGDDISAIIHSGSDAFAQFFALQQVSQQPNQTIVVNPDGTTTVVGSTSGVPVAFPGTVPGVMDGGWSTYVGDSGPSLLLLAAIALAVFILIRVL